MKKIIFILIVAVFVVFTSLAIFFNSPQLTKNIEELDLSQFRFFIKRDNQLSVINVANRVPESYSILNSIQLIKPDPIQRLSNQGILIGTPTNILLVSAQKVEDLVVADENEKITHFSIGLNASYLALITNQQNQAILYVLFRAEDSKKWNEKIKKTITIPFSDFMYSGWIPWEKKVVLLSSGKETEIIDLESGDSYISEDREILYQLSNPPIGYQHSVSEGMAGAFQGEVSSWDETQKLLVQSKSRVLWKEYTFELTNKEGTNKLWQWIKFPLASYIQNVEWLSDNRHLLLTTSNFGKKKFFILDTTTKDIAYLGQGEEVSWIDTSSN